MAQQKSVFADFHLRGSDLKFEIPFDIVKEYIPWLAEHFVKVKASLPPLSSSWSKDSDHVRRWSVNEVGMRPKHLQIVLEFLKRCKKEGEPVIDFADGEYVAPDGREVFLTAFRQDLTKVN